MVVTVKNIYPTQMYLLKIIPRIYTVLINEDIINWTSIIIILFRCQNAVNNKPILNTENMI